jgi:hypothetical protein
MRTKKCSGGIRRVCAACGERDRDNAQLIVVTLRALEVVDVKGVSAPRTIQTKVLMHRLCIALKRPLLNPIPSNAYPTKEESDG